MLCQFRCLLVAAAAGLVLALAVPAIESAPQAEARLGDRARAVLRFVSGVERRAERRAARQAEGRQVLPLLRRRGASGC